MENRENKRKPRISLEGLTYEIRVLKRDSKKNQSKNTTFPRTKGHESPDSKGPQWPK